MATDVPLVRHLAVVNGVLFGVTMAGLPELRQRYTAWTRNGNEPRWSNISPNARHPAPSTAAKITVEVTLSDPETTEDFSQQLLSLSTGGMASHERGGKRVYEIGTNSDPQEVARRITWAKVTGVDGSTIRVAATSLTGGLPAPAR